MAFLTLFIINELVSITLRTICLICSFEQYDNIVSFQCICNDVKRSCFVVCFSYLSMTKRLHGWALEKETGKNQTSESSKSAPQSALASKLLSLWAHGSLSATAIQEIAHLAILDGANHPELALMAKAGSFGENPGNIHREIVRSFCKDLQIAEPFVLQVSCIDPKSSAEDVVDAAMFLPPYVFKFRQIQP